MDKGDFFLSNHKWTPAAQQRGRINIKKTSIKIDKGHRGKQINMSRGGGVHRRDARLIHITVWVKGETHRALMALRTKLSLKQTLLHTGNLNIQAGERDEVLVVWAVGVIHDFEHFSGLVSM